MSTGQQTVVPRNLHNSDSLAKDKRGWRELGDYYHGLAHADVGTILRKLPGDMGMRSTWKHEGYLSYSLYSPISCALGQAVVENAEHLERVSELAKEYGKVILFTAVNETLVAAARSQPEKFIELLQQGSWMGDVETQAIVSLFAAVSK